MHARLMVLAGTAALLAPLIVMQPEAAAQPGVSTELDDSSYQPPVRYLDQGERDGFTASASIGRGSIEIDCDICDNVRPITEGLSLSLHGGFMLNPRLAVIGEYWSVRYNGRGSDFFPDAQDHYVAQHMVTAGAQLWLLRRFYLRAGLGAGWHHSDSRYAKVGRDRVRTNLRPATSEPVMDSQAGKYTPAASFGIGFEFAHTTRFAADIQLRVGSTRRPSDEYQVHNVALTFGAAWF